MFGKRSVDDTADEREQEERKILRKISKLLQKAESTSSDAEAETAERLAREMMEEHSISRGELDRKDFVRSVIQSRYKRTPGWQKEIIFKVTRYLGCYALHTRTGKMTHQEWKIFGHRRDVQLARYMVGTIEAQIEELVERFKTERKAEKRRLTEKIQELERQNEEIQEHIDSDDPDRDPEDFFPEGLDSWVEDIDRELRMKQIENSHQIDGLKEQMEELDTGRKATNGYRTGLAKGVTQRLWEMAESVSGGDAEKALVPVEERKEKRAKAEQMYDGKVSSSFGGPSSSDMAATRKGYEDSDKINVHKAAKGSDDSSPQALPSA